MNDAAINVLDDVIANVEEHGFDATTFHGLRACYIGMTRRVCGLVPEPIESTIEGGVPAVATVLNALDAVAQVKREDFHLWPTYQRMHDPGRIAERFGLNLVHQGRVRRENQAPIALEVLREARARLAAGETPTPTTALAPAPKPESKRLIRIDMIFGTPAIETSAETNNERELVPA